MTTQVVGVEGFEPPTSCSQSRRATGLRYTPFLNNHCLSSSLVSEVRIIVVARHCVNNIVQFATIKRLKFQRMTQIH